MDGLKESTISRHVAELLFEMGEIKGEIESATIPTFLANLAEVTTFFKEGKHQDLITLAVDNDKAGHTFIERLTDKKITFVSDLPPTTKSQEKIDWNDYLKEIKEKALDRSQEQQKKERTYLHMGSLQPEAEGSTSPVLETSTFERSVTSRPTSSYPYLHFTTNYAEVQKRIGNYHLITPVDLKRLNQYAPSIQSTARWYLDELADSKISFIYADRGIENILEVTFQKENFIHLSGIRPFEEGKGAADFLEDFASGYGSYDGVLISNAIKDKLQVLPMLQDILEPQSFVLDDLTSVEKLHNLNMSEAIKSKDEDFLLLFKDAGDEKIPASLMKLKGELATNVQDLAEKTILGIYRERNGQIEQLAINDDYVKDDGEEMLSVLKNRQYEEVLERIEPQNEQLSQPENQSLNQELGKDLDRPLNVLESVSEDAEMGQEASSISPKQEIKTGLARRVEEIIKQNQKEALVASIPELQEKLSRESDLMGSSLTDGGMLYTHQESFGKDYQLELAVHSSTAVESLTEQPAPWSLAVLKDNQILGYLAYGSDWGNDFQIEDNSIGEKIGTTIHELAHATLHNFHEGKKEVSLSSGRKELEAEMTSYLVSKHFGLDTSEKAIRYMSHWTNQLKDLNDKELNQSMTRIHKTVSCVIKSVEKHTKPYQMNRNRGQNFGSRFPNKSLKM